MNRILLGALLMLVAAGTAHSQNRPVSVLKDGALEILRWTDACNVYVITDGEAAILIDGGDGSVVEQLQEIGVKRLEWVLYTHHHREQCMGHDRLAAAGARAAGPERERSLFETPLQFRKAKPSLNDAFSVHGASYVRPPIRPVKLDQVFKPMDVFTWRGREFWCLQTAGNSPAGMSYLLKTAKGWIGFSGDVMLAGAKMHTWFDSEWDYGSGKGIYTLLESASLLEGFEPALLLPSHGPVIDRPRRDLTDYRNKLKHLARLYKHRDTLPSFDSAESDRVSRPSEVPHLWRISPHLFKYKGQNHSPNFTLLIADSGRALMIDAGIDPKTLDATIEAARERLGLKGIDAVLVTHMHGDHCVHAPHVREKHGAKLWTLDRVAPPVQEPERFEYCAMPWSYRAEIGPIRFDRLFKPGEKVKWEGYELTVDWMPGQTEFGCCITGMIDGKRVAFTGDNIFADAADPAQDGHTALCARNSAILEEGFIYAADYLKKLKTDILVGGHSYVMDNPAELIERYRAWGVAMREAFEAVSPAEDYRITFDPYWVRADPYRVKVARGGAAEFTLHLRNFLSRPQKHRLTINSPDGITVAPRTIEATVPGQSIVPVKLTLKAAEGLAPGVHLIAIDVELDGHRHGPLFDAIVNVTPAAR